MNLIEALGNMNNNEFPQLTNGNAATVGELWAMVKNVHFPDFDRVRTMFAYLKRYVDEPDAVFAIRAGNTRKDNDGKTLRRGFLTAFKHDKRRYFYTDNDFATIIAKLIYDTDWVMDYDEFKQTMLDRTFPVHFNASCTEEKDKAAYKIDGKNPGIGDGGYKVSHLIDVGTKYYFGGKRLWNLAKVCEEYFPLEDYDKWKLNADGYYIREIDGALSAEQERFLKAHFLRFACPLNYIFTPKQSGQIFGEVKIPKNDVGECPELLAYAKEQLKELYPDVYNEYFSLLMLPPENPEDYPLDVTYVFKGKKVSKPKTTNPEETESSGDTISSIHTGSEPPSAATRAFRGKNKARVFSVLTDIINAGKILPTTLKNLQSSDFAKKHFKLSTFPVLIKGTDFSLSGKERKRFYQETLQINGETYLVCSQMSGSSIDLLEAWANSI